MSARRTPTRQQHPGLAHTSVTKARGRDHDQLAASRLQHGARRRSQKLRSGEGRLMARIRIGVIGCGLIGQMMHLPHLRELDELYDLRAVCDLSPGTLAHVGERFGVTRRFTDWRELLRED